MLRLSTRFHGDFPVNAGMEKAPHWGTFLTEGAPMGCFFHAADGTRTRTVSLPGDFKSPVSTDSTTAAYSPGVPQGQIILAYFTRAVKGL